MKPFFIPSIALMFCGITCAVGQPLIRPIHFSEVILDDGFWKTYAHKVSEVTVPVCMEYTEAKTGRIRNFERAAGLLNDGKGHEGIYYDDSDVYKALEAIAYSLKIYPSPQVEKRADEWIDKIAAAQEPDGYINTFYTLTGLENRWSDMEKHEDYCAGHLIEAGIAYYYATGKNKLMNVGIRMADHMDSIFGPGKRNWVTGHQEVELALVKLYEATGNKNYLNLANWFISQRGHGYGVGRIWDNPAWGPRYCQDDQPIEAISHITGHAVRAMYYYTGVADVASYTKNTTYLNAMQRVWEDVVHKNVYLTGAIGSSRHNEGFTKSFDLPNAEAYGETCASVGMVFWNQRMNQLTGNAMYIDVLERSLFNGALAGISLTGDRFFYPNPLTSYEGDTRKEWFGTACCPSNIARLLASVGNYLYAHDEHDIWLNIYAGSKTTVSLKNNRVKLTQQTNYPWEGSVSLLLEPEHTGEFALHLRIPGWARNDAISGGLYRFANTETPDTEIRINGKPTQYKMVNGYAIVHNTWKKGDRVDIRIPMEIKRVLASDSVSQDRGKVALQRGPLVYCLEEADNASGIFNVILKDDVPLLETWEPHLLGGIYTLSGEVEAVIPTPDRASATTSVQPFKAIPYFAWANRGKQPMQVWIPRRVTSILLNKE
ncbi:hypothetical protein GCM10011386_17930 [Parapedobacter defluvii]|uniref:Glycoside hydrolase family 127 protein n=1 Tax=Parapedobacter defluvii TaxID=2045106 RepID=A0ABQ1LN93_9SPHI|nr:beta-L-arabinofuranosidase domain-containing protein [Parapedobacter defluvii]GGC26320.1 hypothetical protein GCM10011386_17930 [Parapedobacter defluvii]